MLSAKCNYDNPADALFCMKCGSKVENRCSSCNTVNPFDTLGVRVIAGSNPAAPTNRNRGFVAQ